MQRRGDISVEDVSVLVRWAGHLLVRKLISLDPGYDESRHWATRSIRNALSHSHTIVFNIVGASSGEGAKVVDKKTGESKLQVAGHAVPIFLPLASTLDAMDAGEYERGDAERASIAAARARVFFPEGKLRAAASPEQLQSLLASPNAEIAASGLSKLRKQHLDGLKREALVPFAIDGTITSEMDMHAPESDAKTRARQARVTLHGFARLGPMIADRVVDLTALGSRNTNAFYHDLVEGVIAGHIGDDPELVALNAAAHNFVYANLDAVRERQGERIEAGASAANVHTGAMALIPLVRLDANAVVMHNAMRQMVRLHSMPPRRPMATQRANAEVHTYVTCSWLTTIAGPDTSMEARGLVSAPPNSERKVYSPGGSPDLHWWWSVVGTHQRAQDGHDAHVSERRERRERRAPLGAVSEGAIGEARGTRQGEPDSEAQGSDGCTLFFLLSVGADLPGTSAKMQGSRLRALNVGKVM